MAAPVTHIWYFKGVPSRLGYLLDMAPKDLEKVIYFAAYMIINVDDEARHRELPELEKELRQEIKQSEKERDALLSDRMVELEKDLAALEEANAKADQKRKTDDAGKKELASIRKSFDDEIAHLERVWDDFRSLKVGDLRAERCRLPGCPGSLRHVLRSPHGCRVHPSSPRGFDLAGEAEKLHDEIANGKGQRKIRAHQAL